MRKLLQALTIVLITLIASQGLTRFREGKVSHAPDVQPLIDWGAVSERDLAIAAIYIYARSHGAGAAVDSLAKLARADTAIAHLGPATLHHIAHTIGWQSSKYEKNVQESFAACPPYFDSGCIHGIIEANFVALHHVDSSYVSSFCPSVVPADRAVQYMRDCAHGVGHGISQAIEHDLFRALRLCDVLSTEGLREECHNGAFMENVSFGALKVQGKDVATAGHMHGQHSAVRDTFFIDPNRPSYPCSDVATQYQASCWEYQPGILFGIYGADLGKSLRACEAAGPNASSCYLGVGKQSMGLYPDRAEIPMRACRTVNPQSVSSCIGGIIEYYTAFSWRADEAVTFCGKLSKEEKATCYSALGRELARMRGSREDAQRECAKGEPQYVPECEKAIESEIASGA